MVNDTYDIKKVQFNLIQMNSEIIENDKSKNKKDFLIYYDNAEGKIHRQSLDNFSDVSIRQVLFDDSNHSKAGLILVRAYISLPIYDFSSGWKGELAYDVMTYLVDSNSFSKDCLLYEALASIMIEEYESYDNEGKRLALCFLQRYMFKTKEKTDEFLREYGIEPPEEYAGLKKLIKMKSKDTNM